MPNQFEAIHDWHSQVGDEDVGAIGFDDLQRCTTRRGRRHTGADRFQHFSQEPEGVRIVIDRQHMRAVQTRRVDQRARFSMPGMNTPLFRVLFRMDNSER